MDTPGTTLLKSSEGISSLTERWESPLETDGLSRAGLEAASAKACKPGQQHHMTQADVGSGMRVQIPLISRHQPQPRHRKPGGGEGRGTADGAQARD